MYEQYQPLREKFDLEKKFSFKSEFHESVRNDQNNIRMQRSY